MQLTSRPVEPNTADPMARVQELRARLEAYLPHLVFESLDTAKERLMAFIHGFGSYDHLVHVYMTSDYATHIEVGYRPTKEVNFYFIPCTISNDWSSIKASATVS
jgi:hypothetical protein